MRIGPVKFLEKVYIGGKEDPLMTRWIILRFPAIGLYVHKFYRSDYDLALHDHPWPFVALILKGGYWEVHDHTETGLETSVWRKPGRVLLRPAEWRHRVVLQEEVRTQLGEPVKCKPSWSLIIVGRRSRYWGFFLPEGWCWWRKHNGALNICEEEIIHTGGSD